MKFMEEKIVAKVVSNEGKVLEEEMIRCHGNCTYRVWSGGKPVQHVYDSYEEAKDYALTCARLNVDYLMKKATIVVLDND